MTPPTPTGDPVTPREIVRAARVGVAVTVVVLVAAFTLPHLADFDPLSRRPYPGEDRIPPLRGYVDVKPWLSTGTLRAVAVGALGLLVLPRLAARARWSLLLPATYVAGLVWLLALAYVDGSDGISRVERMPGEYLDTAVTVTDVPATLDGFVGRLTYGEPDSWPTHVAGHPPAALLFFVALVRLGIDTSYGVGLVVTLVAAAGTPGVLVALRALGAEQAARRAAPFLVLVPAATVMAVSADAVFATTTTWGLACLALAATARRTTSATVLALAAGLLLGLGVFLSYGLVLIGPVALAVLACARCWRPLPWAIGAAVAVALVFGAYGFWWPEAYGPLRDRYLAGLGGERPQAYWVWGNVGALLVSAGPVVGAGVAVALRRGRALLRGPSTEERTTVPLVLSAAVSLLLADLSGMSKSEVERIWLPWIPWLLVSAALLPPRWQRPALAVQVVTALLLQQLVFTQW